MRKSPDAEIQGKTIIDMSGRISRRSVLGGAAAIGLGAACMTSTRAMAQSKQKQSDVQYVAKAPGDQKCGGCALFQAPKSCQAVEGDISPDGYCSLFTPKA